MRSSRHRAKRYGRRLKKMNLMSPWLFARQLKEVNLLPVKSCLEPVEGYLTVTASIGCNLLSLTLAEAFPL